MLILFAFFENERIKTDNCFKKIFSPRSKSQHNINKNQNNALHQEIFWRRYRALAR